MDLFSHELAKVEAQLSRCKAALGRLMDDVNAVSADLDDIAYAWPNNASPEAVLGARDRIDAARERARVAWVEWSKEGRNG